MLEPLHPYEFDLDPSMQDEFKFLLGGNVGLNICYSITRRQWLLTLPDSDQSTSVKSLIINPTKIYNIGRDTITPGGIRITATDSRGGVKGITINLINKESANFV